MDNYYRFPFSRPHPVSSPFGPRGGGFHYGVDFGWNTDDGERHFAVLASADGVCTYYADEGIGGGRTMTLRHEGGESSRYYHLDHNVVNVGDPVIAGQLIAISGETGGVAPHLHFEIHDEKGKPVDPLPLLEWPSTPAPEPVPPIQENPLPPYVYSVNDTWFWVWFDPARGQFVKRYVPPEEASVANRCIFAGQAKGIFPTDNLDGIPDA